MKRNLQLNGKAEIHLFNEFDVAYGQRYLLEISTGTGVLLYADSEYAIFFTENTTFKTPPG
jgi:hypothetical protein